MTDWAIVIFALLSIAALIYIAFKSFDHPFASAKTNVLAWIFFGAALLLLPFPIISGAWMVAYVIGVAYMSMKIARVVGKRAGWEEPEAV